MVVLLIVIMSFLTTFVTVIGVNNLLVNNQLTIQKRLSHVSLLKDSGIEGGDFSKSFYLRVIAPVAKSISSVLISITPKEIIVNFENSILAAGSPFGYGISEWLMVQMFFIIVLPLTSITLGVGFGAEMSRMIGVAGIFILLGLVGPKLILSTKSQQRQKEIIKTLPDILDLLTVSVEAGLGFDAALGKVVEKIPGALAKEFDRTLQEIKMGKPKKDALKDMSDRISVVDFTTFIASIIQADHLGVSIGNVLRIQSHQMRLKRRQRAQEKAMKAPVKMLIPMVIFIFPTIFTVILGPAVIKLMNIFGK